MSKFPMPTQADDIIPETVAEALALWDSGHSVFTVEMGGIGPGYEYCIQALAFEIMRAWNAVEWPRLGDDMPKEFRDARTAEADAIVGRLNDQYGFSGAQVGAAQSLASCVCRRGYRAAMRDPAVADRLIQVERNMPTAARTRDEGGAS